MLFIVKVKELTNTWRAHGFVFLRRGYSLHDDRNLYLISYFKLISLFGTIPLFGPLSRGEGYDFLGYLQFGIHGLN